MPYEHHLPLVVVPRPAATLPSEATSISAPTEESMTQVFGALLPPAKYLTTPYGKAAYYVYQPKTTTASPRRILMIHGLQTSALGLQPLAAALQNLYPTAEIALIDLWGHGLTDTPLAPHVPELFHWLMTTVLATLEWRDPVHLVGYSFGGSLAAGYAAAHPEKVASVVFVAPAGLLSLMAIPEDKRIKFGLQKPLDYEVDELGAREIILEFLEDGELVVPEDWQEKVARGEVVAPAVRDWELKTHTGHAGSMVGIFRDGKVFENFDSFRAAVANLGVDRLLGVVGDHDGFCGKQNLTDVGVANTVEVPNSGHALVREQVPEVAAVIRGFWGEV